MSSVPNDAQDDSQRVNNGTAALPPLDQFPDNLDAAALDARIEELTRRRSEMARRAAVEGGGSEMDAPQAQSQKNNVAMAGIAGAAADSFAQAFVDRFASSHQGGVRGMTAGGGMMQGNEQQGNPMMMMGMANGMEGGMNAAAGNKPQDIKKNDAMGAGMAGYEQVMMCGMAAPGGASGTTPPAMAEMDSIRQSSGQSGMPSQFGGQMTDRESSMNGMNSASAAAGMDMAQTMSMGMNYPGMAGNQGMMGGMPGAGGMNGMGGGGYDRRGSQMSMEGAQAFQNWQQQQQMANFQMQQRMGMMGGRDFPNGAGGMMMGNNMMMPGMNMMQGMHPGMMHPMQQQQTQMQQMPANATPPKAKKAAPKKRNQSTEIEITPELVEASKGPFKTLEVGIPLALDEDKDWLTPLHCFVRRNCVEAFTATAEDVQAPSKGKRKPIQIGQVGIRCPHCHVPSAPKNEVDPETNESTRERGSIYYPTSLSSIYNATMNLLQRHIHSCPRVPKNVMERYADLKQDDARSGTSKKYWVESAKSIGFVDTLKGIRLSADAPPSLRADLFSGQAEEAVKRKSEGDGEESDKDDKSESGKSKSDEKEKDEGDSKEEGKGEEKEKGKDDEKKEAKSEAKSDEKDPESEVEAVPLVLPSDKEASTAFSYLLLSQMQPCVFTEADRLGKRKGLPTGFAGLACRHCFGGYGSGRFFPSSIKTLSDTSKTLNVLHNHMTRCRKCPQEVIEQLAKAKESHEDERAKMKFGSQKAFFAKIWARLHDNRPYDPVAVRSVNQNKSSSNDGAMSNVNAQPRTLQYGPGMNGTDMAFMAGQMPMMGGPQAQMSMMGGPQGQMPMMGGPQGQMAMMGGPQGQMQMMGGPQSQMQMMGGPQHMNMGMNMGMGMMPHPDMMRMGGYPEQFMGGFNGMAQFGGGGGGFSQPPQKSSRKRSAEDDGMDGNKRSREV